jgi:hypothetical protein
VANPEHLKILEQGVEVWNEWRRSKSRGIPRLRDADRVQEWLDGAGLTRADLTEANLMAMHLTGAELSGADLTGADLYEANLRGARLIGATLERSRIHYAYLDKADLTGADLVRADLLGAQFKGARLRGAFLMGATLSGARLHNANLVESHLQGANLCDTDFQGANLTRAYIGRDLSDHWGMTVFANNDLSTVRGLETIIHEGPSTIGIDTIYRSGGTIPEAFLRGCGVPESFVTYARSLTAKPIDIYSCFISYSSRDQELAERLHADLQANRVRVWFAPHDLPIGARIRSAIDESIRLHDKLLLVLSEASVSSQWVEQEVETALAKERESEGKTILFPIRIDDAVMESKAGWPTLLRNTRNIGDFTRWQDHGSYRMAFQRLLRDLKAGG